VQFLKRQLPKSVLAAALSPLLAHSSCGARHPLQPEAPQKASPNLWEVAAWTKLHIWEIGLWVNVFGKVLYTQNSYSWNAINSAFMFHVLWIALYCTLKYGNIETI